MELVKLSEMKWIYSEEMDIHIGVADNLPNNPAADIVYAKLSPGAALPLHTHSRPTADGYEAFFFFNGADIMLILADEERRIAIAEPFHLTFVGDEHHGIVNLGRSDLIFEVICAPRHVEGEETITRPLER